MSAPSVLDTASATSHSLDCSIEEYRAIIKRLSEKLKEVTIMNDKWQKYNDDRETYVGGVRTDLKRTRKQLRDKEKELSEANTKAVQLEKNVKDQQTTIANFGKLMDDLDEKEDRERALLLRVTELEGEVSSLKRSQGRGEKNAEGVTLLQEQLEVCIDDFRTERREKEKFKLEALTLRKKSTETDNILRDYQEKIALIKSLEFPLFPRESSQRHHHQRRPNPRRKTSTHPRDQGASEYRPPVKSSSWSYPSFSGSIEADQAESGVRKSASECDVNELEGAMGGIPVKPLVELFPDSGAAVETGGTQPGSDSVFMEENGGDELVRH